jgi:hypothetical protein
MIFVAARRCFGSGSCPGMNQRSDGAIVRTAPAATATVPTTTSTIAVIAFLALK